MKKYDYALLFLCLLLVQLCAIVLIYAVPALRNVAGGDVLLTPKYTLLLAATILFCLTAGVVFASYFISRRKFTRMVQKAIRECQRQQTSKFKVEAKKNPNTFGFEEINIVENETERIVAVIKSKEFIGDGLLRRISALFEQSQEEAAQKFPAGTFRPSSLNDKEFLCYEGGPLKVTVVPYVDETLQVTFAITDEELLGILEEKQEETKE